MSLRRLLGFSAHLRRSLCTAATPPPDSGRQQGCWTWHMLEKMTAAVGSSPSPYLRAVGPPGVSRLYMPDYLANTSGLPEPDPEGDDVVRFSVGQACSVSQDGLLLLSCQDIRVTAPVLARQGGHKVRDMTGVGLADPDRLPDMAHIVFNPHNGHPRRLPPIQGPKKILAGFHLGILTQRGPPGRYAVAELDGNANVMLRFLPETGDWDLLKCSPCHLPAQRRMVPTQEVVPFSGHLWWVDVTWGVICADPFSDRPEPRFTELPSGSVLPADAHDQAIRQGSLMPDAEGNVWWMQAPAMYRRVGLSGGWLRYVEVSEEEPFVLSSFALNADSSGWTLEHRVPLSPLWADGGYPWQGATRPKIGVLDMAQPNVVYLIAGDHMVVVDMQKGEVVEHCPHQGDICILPCTLTSWLAESRIPSPGKSDVTENTLADVLVRSDRLQKK